MQQLTVFIVKVIRLPFVFHSSFVCVLFVCRRQTNKTQTKDE
ncbi:hypothetical protein HMPREF1981_03001 [Bacteroides pyogenes F0041]|uniref:Uncharacterized protein n=1 Tax=Bacteroides pyogenes F0041 TaxID=1321819 RepID=U2DJC7_9BACE|nr:hypothetical protein HMPREF1981_03001 [Bacteroides pyogenes F0041]